MTEIEQFIRLAAVQRGIDPDIAVRVARAEGGLEDPVRQSNVVKNGRREPSYGPFQLYMGGGLGNRALAAGIDPRNPNQWKAGVEFALDEAARKGWGQWYGARAVGLSNSAGIANAKAKGVYDTSGANTLATAPAADPLDELQTLADGQSLADTQFNMNADAPIAKAPAKAPIALPQGGTFLENLLNPEYVAAEAARIPKLVNQGILEAPAFAYDAAAGAASWLEQLLGYTDETSPVAIPLSQGAEATRRMARDLSHVDEPQNMLEAGAKFAPLGALGGAAGVLTSGLISSGMYYLAGQLDLDEVAKPYREAVAREQGLPPPEGSIGDLIREQTHQAFHPTWLNPMTNTIEPMYDVTQPEQPTIPMIGAKAPITPPVPRPRPFQATDLLIPSAWALDAEEGTSVPINTMGGPTRVKTSELATVGWLGLLSIGMMFSPGLYKFARQGLGPRAPRPRVVDTQNVIAPRGATSLERQTDLLTAQVFDNTAIPKAVLARSGAPADVVTKLVDGFDISSGSGLRSLIHTALGHGEMDSMAGVFRVPVALNQLSQTVKRMPGAIQNAIQEYLHLNHTLDDLNRTGAQYVRGMDVATANARKTQLEGAYPVVIDVKRAFKENVDETIRFLSEGPYAVMTPSQATTMTNLAGNWVPLAVDLLAGRNFAERSMILAKGTVRPKSRIMKKPQAKPQASQLPMRDPIEAQMEYQYAALQTRIENELMGQYVDAMKASPNGAGSMIRVSPKYMADHPHQRENFITIYRQGKPEHYWTTQGIADTFRFDPYYPLNSALMAFERSKRLFELGTTGYLAPWFPFVQAWRDIRIGKITAPYGTKKPTYTGAMIGIPKQISAKIARSMSEGMLQSLNAGSSNWFTKILGPNNAGALATRLANAYNRSLVSAIERIGNSNVSITQHQIKLTYKLLDDMAQYVPVPLRRSWSAWKEIVDSVQSAGQFSFLNRNWDYSGTAAATAANRKLVAEARRLTGDPSKGGQYKVSVPGGGHRPIAIQSTSEKPRLGILPRIVGPTAEAHRIIVPWTNPMLQGMRRLGQAYLKNPVRFTARMWKYVGMPAATTYAWNSYLGPEYVKYMMETRSEYDRSMYLYIGVPGQPPEKGIEIPMFHELSPIKRLVETGLDHMYRSDEQLRTHSQEWLAAANMFLQTAVIPAYGSVPLAAFVSNMTNTTLPTPFGGGNLGAPAYVNEDPPYESMGWNKTFESVARALGGSMADVLGASFAAMTEEGSTGLPAAAEELAFQLKKKMPIVRNITGAKTIGAGSQLGNEVFRKQDKIDEMATYMHELDNVIRGTSTKPRSEAGAKAQGFPWKKGADPRANLPGPPPKLPTNPEYIAFMKEVYKRFNTDAGSTNVKGYLSLWSRHADFTAMLKRMRMVNAGNLPAAKAWIMSKPDLRATAAALGVTMDNRTDAVVWINKLEEARNELRKRMLIVIKKTERDMSRAAGHEVTLETLKPN